MVRHCSRDSLPCQDEDHQNSRVAVVAWSLSDQTQQLLLFTPTPDHLTGDLADNESDGGQTAHMHNHVSEGSSSFLKYTANMQSEENDGIMSIAAITYPFSYGTPLGAPAFSPGINNNFHPHCISFGTIPVGTFGILSM